MDEVAGLKQAHLDEEARLKLECDERQREMNALKDAEVSEIQSQHGNAISELQQKLDLVHAEKQHMREDLRNLDLSKVAREHDELATQLTHIQANAENLPLADNATATGDDENAFSNSFKACMRRNIRSATLVKYE